MILLFHRNDEPISIESGNKKDKRHMVDCRLSFFGPVAPRVGAL